MVQFAGIVSPRLPSPPAGLRADGAPAPAVQRRALYLVGEEDRSAGKPAVAPERTMICLNGRWHAMRGDVATFEQIVGLAIPPLRPGQTLAALSVTYRRGTPERPSGSLNPGDVVPIVDGMLVNANATTLS